jgi:hypothetical protein
VRLRAGEGDWKKEETKKEVGKPHVRKNGEEAEEEEEEEERKEARR